MPPRKAPEPPAEGLLDLFGAQEVPPLKVATPERIYGAAAAQVKWLKVPLTGGPHLCTLCVRAVHGVPDGPSPLRATARRRGPNEDLLLCPEHKQIMRELDDKAEAERKAREQRDGRGRAGPAKPKKHREHA